MRTFIVASVMVAAHLATLAIPRVACAAAGDGSSSTSNDHARPERTETKKLEDKHDGLDIGVLGGVGFPRPLAIEAVVGFDRLVMVGAEYGLLPKTTIGSVQTELSSVAGDLRVFPFKGAFFIGLRGGYQELAGSVTLTATNIGSYTESLSVGTWFINPRVGFLWRIDPFAIGIDAGVQVPVSSSSTRSTSTSVAGLALDARITDTADALGRSVLPTIDLLRVGLVF